MTTVATREATPDPRAAVGADRRGEIGVRIVFLSTALARRRDRRVAAAIIAISILALAAAAPFAQIELPPVPAFMPIYETALIACDLVTAILLLGQFAMLRSRALLALAGGYLFTAWMTIAHGLTFPGLFSPSGLLGAGPQSTAWLYMFWHGGFPLAVIAYALLLRRTDDDRVQMRAATAIPWAVLGTLLAACALALVATAGEAMLPAIMDGNRYTQAMIGVVSSVWGFGILAVILLWFRRPHVVLDLWLTVVICAWLCDVALSAVLNAGRYDLGFYAGRIHGLLAASFVLAVMLVQTVRLYGRLAASAHWLTDYAGTLEARVGERTAELESRTRELSYLFEHSPLPKWVYDPETLRFLMVNDAAIMTYGYTREAFLSMRLVDIMPPEDVERMLKTGANAQPYQQSKDWRHRLKDGRIVDVDTYSHAFSFQGKPARIVVALDVTARKSAETQLRQSQKMEALGQLTGGLAHDFNNLLLVIMGNLGLLRDMRPDDDEADELVREALDAATRGSDLTRSLLAFARRQPLEPERADVNQRVAEITTLLTRTLGERVEISLDLSPDLWPVVVDPIQLEAALANLATNARDAMPKGGRLSIATANRRLDEDYAAQHADVTHGDFVMLQVSDTGSGMPPDILAKVFEPFFTTKERGAGTGLGLSMVFGFMRQSGGHINVYSEVGVGTTFRLYLPRDRSAVNADAKPDRRPAARGHGERVLAVEDDAALRRLAQKQLGQLGYRVATAANATEALELLEQDGPFDVLFTDVVMAGKVDGIDLARIVLDRWPATSIVMTSGFPDHAVDGYAPLAAHVRLLSKPYQKDDLARLLRDALDVAADAV